MEIPCCVERRGRMVTRASKIASDISVLSVRFDSQRSHDGAHAVPLQQRPLHIYIYRYIYIHTHDIHAHIPPPRRGTMVRVFGVRGLFWRERSPREGTR
jgi:hypothetical protein